jgi:hypothetical protein
MGAAALKRSAALAGVLVLLALPFLANSLRRTADPHCALDGGALVPSYRVRVDDAAGKTHEFCCLRCAEIWLDRQARPVRAIRVTDEASGKEIDASEAYYIRSLVVTTPTTGNRIHVFLDRTDAEHHARTCRGTVLVDEERPFGRVPYLLPSDQ